MSYHRTATDLAAALLCTPRAKQDVRVVSQTFGGGFFRAIVLVVPAGQETGTYYITRRQKAIDELARVQKEIQEHAKAMDDLQTEARRAGAPAGWLR